MSEVVTALLEPLVVGCREVDTACCPTLTGLESTESCAPPHSHFETPSSPLFLARVQNCNSRWPIPDIKCLSKHRSLLGTSWRYILYTFKASEHQPYLGFPGGGGTFGVVLESTTLASPEVTLQSVLFIVSGATDAQLEEIFSIVVDNAVNWADKGWGGSIKGPALVYVNPVLESASANATMAPLIDYAASLQNAGVAVTLVVKEYPSWKSFYDFFSAAFGSVSPSRFTDSYRLGHSMIYSAIECRI